MIQTFVRGGQLPYGIRILANWHINNFINQRTQIGIFALRTSTFGRGYSRAISIKMIYLAAMINAAVFLLNVHLDITYCIFMVISLSRNFHGRETDPLRIFKRFQSGEGPMFLIRSTLYRTKIKSQQKFTTVNVVNINLSFIEN